MNDTYETERQTVEELQGARARLKAELSKVIIGQENVVDHLLLAVFSRTLLTYWSSGTS